MKTNEQWRITREAAELYERVVARHILGPWAPLLVEEAGLAVGERVLDLACGTGVVSRIAAQRVGRDGRVIGVDLNTGMLAVARSLPAPDGSRIEWLEGSAMAIPLPDASCDVLLCQQGLQFFLDQPLALGEMRRVLDHGGRLALSVWNGVGPYNTAVGNALALLVDNDVASRFLASRRAPGREELEALARAARFANVNLTVARMHIRLPAVETFSLEHLSATPVADAIASLEAGVRASIGASVMNQLAAYRDADGVMYPEQTYVLTASA